MLFSLSNVCVFAYLFQQSDGNSAVSVSLSAVVVQPEYHQYPTLYGGVVVRIGGIAHTTLITNAQSQPSQPLLKASKNPEHPIAEFGVFF